MKKMWCLVDNNGNSGSLTAFGSTEEALRYADRVWSSMTENDRESCEEFAVVLVYVNNAETDYAEDDDGNVLSDWIEVAKDYLEP